MVREPSPFFQQKEVVLEDKASIPVEIIFSNSKRESHCSGQEKVGFLETKAYIVYCYTLLDLGEIT